MIPKWRKRLGWAMIFSVILAAIVLWGYYRADKVTETVPTSLNERIEISFELAKTKLTQTLNYLDQPSRYPTYTENESLNNRRNIANGTWVVRSPKFWAAGAFPALLWKMSTYESEPAQKAFWQTQAQRWSEPLRNKAESSQEKDMTMNNLFVFRPWFESVSGEKKAQQLTTLLRGAQILAEPFDSGIGRFQTNIGVIGWKRKADRSDKQKHWQAFIDHTINVEQLLWAAAHNPNKNEAKDWQNKAVRHIKTLAKTWGSQRKPGSSGTWQRGYFDDNPVSSTYGQFLFNESKQGWQDSSTWSRGQAWVIYSTSVAYQYINDPEVLAIAKKAINYFLDYLPERFVGAKRRRDDFIAPWDFDYALQVNPDTERDSSAAAIAVSGILKLVNVLPDTDSHKQRYLKDVEAILYQLSSPTYLTSLKSSQMSILHHGCYHHYDAMQPSQTYDNGLIWGDYFFIDALIDYVNLVKNPLKN